MSQTDRQLCSALDFISLINFNFKDSYQIPERFLCAY
jgi:hypothetical protein